MQWKTHGVVDTVWIQLGVKEVQHRDEILKQFLVRR